MTAHTPGPWRFSAGDLPRVVAGAIAICGVHRIGRHAGGEHTAEVIGNGNLIAAAPELYDALAALLRHCETGFTGWPATLGEVEARTRAVAALAKARGESQ